MNSRNVFKLRPPNYEELAKKYPEFRPKCFIGAGGKVCVNFGDPEAVRLLTRFLLLDYFELDVQIPVGSLVPRVPQRLNYILLVEHLITSNKLDSEPVWGIDIGTGPSCIYPLLGATSNRWNFVATEIDTNSICCAVANIGRNNLEQCIQLVQPTGDSIFKEVFSSEQNRHRNFAFTMCNPPFFDPEEADQKFAKFHDLQGGGLTMKNLVGEQQSNQSNRTPPKSATSATRGEIAYMGGEVAFVTRMLEESMELDGGRVAIYTSMVGKVANLQPLKKLLRKHGVRHAVNTLTQGKTARWTMDVEGDTDKVRVFVGFQADVEDSELLDQDQLAARCPDLFIDGTNGPPQLPSAPVPIAKLLTGELFLPCSLHSYLDRTYTTKNALEILEELEMVLGMLVVFNETDANFTKLLEYSLALLDCCGAVLIEASSPELCERLSQLQANVKQFVGIQRYFASNMSLIDTKRGFNSSPAEEHADYHSEQITLREVVQQADTT